MLLPYMCQQQISPKCHTYAKYPNYSMSFNEGNMLIYMQHINSLASSAWWAMLYTEHNDANTDNDDEATWLP